MEKGRRAKRRPRRTDNESNACRTYVYNFPDGVMRIEASVDAVGVILAADTEVTVAAAGTGAAVGTPVIVGFAVAAIIWGLFQAQENGM